MKLIPINDVKIERDFNKFVGWDLTVEDNYTFCTSDGVFVQDTMSIHLPISEKACDESINFSVENNLESDANGDPLIYPTHEMVVGLFLMSSIDDDSKVLRISEDCAIRKYELNEIDINTPLLVDGIKTSVGILLLINITGIEIIKPITKDNIKSLVKIIIHKFGNSAALSILKKLQDVSYEVVTKYGFSFCMDDLNKSSAFIKILKESKARATESQINQVLGERSNYFLESMMSRKSMINTITITQKAGHLLRKLINTCRKFFIVEDDCKIDGVRSSVFCKSTGGICSKCYGKSVDVGNPVGIIAAQSIIEPLMQEGLRLFHDSKNESPISKLNTLSDLLEVRSKYQSLDEFYEDTKQKLLSLYDSINVNHIELIIRALTDFVIIDDDLESRLFTHDGVVQILGLTKLCKIQTSWFDGLRFGDVKNILETNSITEKSSQSFLEKLC